MSEEKSSSNNTNAQEDCDVACPCCKTNPWGAATGAFFAKLCATCEDTVEEGKGLSRDNMDFTVAPSDNFFHYANGNWIKNNPIPAGYPAWNTFVSLHVQSQENLKVLLQELEEKKNEDLSQDERKVALFYKAALDEATIKTVGVTDAVQPIVASIQRIVHLFNNKNNDEGGAFEEALGVFSATYGLNPFFAIGASPDHKNSDHSICQISQGGLGLPDRDYYFDEDKEEKRTAYKKHIATMLALLNGEELAVTNDDAETKTTEVPAQYIDEANKVYALELALAEGHMTKTENRDPEKTYNTMSIEELTEKCASTDSEGKKSSFHFASYLKGATYNKDLGDFVNVCNVKAIQTFVQVASSQSADVLENYLKWGMVRSYASYLPKAFVDHDFEFYSKTLAGIAEIKPRWKRAMAFTEGALGDSLGQLYCARHFDNKSKERALQIVESVRMALEERLKEVEWMKSSSTRESALQKMSKFRIKIGYPDKWIDYSSFVINEDDTFCAMVQKSRAFAHKRDVDEMNAPTDREKWFMTPQTVNAYYHPSLNEIVFPAAILQHPFFDPDADDAVNFGSLGCVVGHEMTHGFDDQGRKFNYEGNMVDWWTEEDAKEYESRVDVQVKQANEFKVYDQYVQGKLTSGENIADTGGILLSYRALMTSMKTNNTDNDDEKNKINGFTPIQRFYFAWAQCWRQNVTKERALQLLTLDPHGPNEMRCNGPLSNIPEFHAAFSIKEGSPMYKPKEDRVDIW
eukprot:CAMPEP_0194139558 /NCGR_PEP_ID=MMETSP0152-20130528/9193_1 /TAXON_ID=1049557 /ORGANISM="Thalassiothrix antarctica, Strain L6-D1" /LENGTH=744 /DNA_ID=CAMNT_0038837439 /DNA_START=295 /DNA_END=2529 /DNA_ORIENTATION=-